MNEEVSAEAPQTYPVTTKAVVALLLGWLLPGAGHFLQKKWIRGTLLMLSVGFMFVLGVLMEGRIYASNAGDLLDMLRFAGDLGAGMLYFISRWMDWGRGSIQLATADYGATFIVVSGLLNVISAIDAYHIAVGKKQ